MPSQKIWGGPLNGRVNKVRIAAAYCGVALEVPPFTMGLTNKSPAYLAKNPLGKARQRAFRSQGPTY